VARHQILQAASAMVVATDMDIEAVSACIPFCFEVCLCTETPFLSFPAMITSTRIWVPSCGLPAVAVVLCEIHLRATTSTTARVTIAADTTVRPAEIGEVEVVVYIPMCSRQVHVPLNIATTSHVE